MYIAYVGKEKLSTLDTIDSIIVEYTGMELRPLFNYNVTKIKGDSAIMFISGMNVPTSHMVDMEDVIADDFIYSPLAVNIICEIFNIGIETAVLYQRLLMRCLFDSLQPYIPLLILSGDDLFVADDSIMKKLSVSIATVSPVSGLIHCGLNIKQPAISIPTVGLEELLETNDLKEIVHVIEGALRTFKHEVESIKSAAVKVRPVI